MLEIDVHGVNNPMKKDAENDIRQYFEPIISSNKKANVRVIVASDFETSVESYRNEYYKKYKKFSANHSHTTALAKTMHFMQHEQLWSAIILDGKYFGSWKKEDFVNRLTTLLHELIHVIDAIAQSNALGMESLFKIEKNLNELFLTFAIENWTEYHANRFPLSVIDEAIKKVDLAGRLEINVDGFANTLTEILKNQVTFVTNLIDDLHSSKISPDSAFEKMVEKVKELLNVAEFFYGQIDYLDDQTKLATIENLSEFSIHLGNSWKKIISINREMYQQNGFELDKIKLISTELHTIYRQCGIQIFEENGSFRFNLLPF